MAFYLRFKPVNILYLKYKIPPYYRSTITRTLKHNSNKLLSNCIFVYLSSQARVDSVSWQKINWLSCSVLISHFANILISKYVCLSVDWKNKQKILNHHIARKSKKSSHIFTFQQDFYLAEGVGGAMWPNCNIFSLLALSFLRLIPQG